MKIAAFGKQNGFIQAHGTDKADVMRQLATIGECEESDFEWLPITDTLAEAVDELGCDIPMERNEDGIWDFFSREE